MSDPTRRRIAKTQLATNWNGNSSISMDCNDNRGISQHQLVVYAAGTPALGSVKIEVRPQGASFYVPIGTMDLTVNGTATMIFVALLDNVRLSFPGGITPGMSIGATIYSTGLFFTVGDDYLSETDRRRVVSDPLGLNWNGSGSVSQEMLNHAGLTQHQFAIAGGTGLVELQGRPQGGTQFVSIDVQTKQIDTSGMLIIFAGMFDAFRLVPQGVVTGTINAQLASVGELLFFNNVSQGSYGDSTHIPVITVNGGGQITSIVSVPINVAGALGYTPANDALVVHLAGAETISGAKTFTPTQTFNAGLNSTTSGSTQNLNLTDTGASGVNIKMTGNGATRPIKYIRVTSGMLDVIDSANSFSIFALNDFGTAGSLIMQGGIYPSADNAYPIGQASTRWSVIYAATGTINTSDSREKTGQVPNNLGLDFVNAIPVSQFKFIVKHNDVKPMVDVNGNAILDANGKFQSVITPVPGVRTHIGSMAQQVATALRNAGIDPGSMGMWSLDDPADPNSRQGLRENELMWVLWTAVQQLSAQVVAIKSKIGMP